jgi:phytoene dehydrogenase-like protein
MTVDAVVVGAGHNGLVAANLLADAGWRVIVLEATEHIGGAVRSTQFVPGHTSDMFSAFYPLGYVSPVLRRLRLEEHGLRWIRSSAALGHVFPDGRVALIEDDPQDTASNLEQWAAGDGERWLQTLRDWHEVRDPLIRALMAPLPAAGPGTKLVLQARPATLARIARLGLSSARTFVQEQWSGEGARTLITGNALHADVSPEATGSALFGWLLSMAGQDLGFPVPVGGAGELTAAMASRLRAAGGEIRTEAPVRRVVTENGRAAGVELADGTRVDARRAVLTDVVAPALYGQMLTEDDLPPGYLDGLRTFHWDNPTLKVNWVLSGKVPWRNPAAGRAGTVQLGGDRDDISRWMNSLSMRELPAKPFVIAGQMGVADPTRSPAGTETVWAYTHVPRTSDDARMHDNVQATAEQIDAIFEEAAPGFGAACVKRVVQTPGDMQRENPSLWHGAINGGTSQLSQQLIFRPMLGLGGARTPVRGLYLASASAHPGGGVHGACGNNAAIAALNDAKPLRGRVNGALLPLVWRTLYPGG